MRTREGGLRREQEMVERERGRIGLKPDTELEAADEPFHIDFGPCR